MGVYVLASVLKQKTYLFQSCVSIHLPNSQKLIHVYKTACKAGNDLHIPQIPNVLTTSLGNFKTKNESNRSKCAQAFRDNGSYNQRQTVRLPPIFSYIFFLNVNNLGSGTCYGRLLRHGYKSKQVALTLCSNNRQQEVCSLYLITEHFSLPETNLKWLPINLKLILIN